MYWPWSGDVHVVLIHSSDCFVLFSQVEVSHFLAIFLSKLIDSGYIVFATLLSVSTVKMLIDDIN